MDNLTVILTAVGGLFTTITVGWIAFKRGRSVLTRDEVSWAVREAREAYRELKKQVGDVWASERECHIRLARYIERNRELTGRVRDLEMKLGIEHAEPIDDDLENLDDWASGVLDREKLRRKDETE